MTRKDDHTTVYAVVRVDSGFSAKGELPSGSGPEIRFGEFDVTVKEVVTSVEEAEREVARLNGLNQDKGCRYYWQSSRYFDDGGSFGTEDV